jgi:hypothetical protein
MLFGKKINMPTTPEDKAARVLRSSETSYIDTSLLDEGAG